MKTSQSETAVNTATALAEKIEGQLSEIHTFDSFGRTVYEAALKEALSRIRSGVDLSLGSIELNIKMTMHIESDESKYVGNTGQWVIVIGADGVGRTVFRGH